MDLKRNQITVGELLDHPGARAVFQQRQMCIRDSRRA